MANNRSFLAERAAHGKPSFSMGTYEPDLIKDNMREAVAQLSARTPLKIVNAGFHSGFDASEAWEPWDIDQENRARSFFEEDQLSHGGANVAYHEQPGSTAEGGIFDSLLDDGDTSRATGIEAGGADALQGERALANQEAGARLFDAGLDDETIASVLEDEEAQELFLRERELRQLSSQTGGTATPDGAFDDEERSVFQDIARRAFEYAADAAEYLSEQPEFLQNAMLHGLDLASGGIVKKALREGALRVAQSALDFDPGAEIARLADQLVAFVEGFSVEELRQENPQAFARAQMGAQVLLALTFLPPRHVKKVLGKLTRRRRAGAQYSGSGSSGYSSGSPNGSHSILKNAGTSAGLSVGGEMLTKLMEDGKFELSASNLRGLLISAIQGAITGAIPKNELTRFIDSAVAMGGSFLKDGFDGKNSFDTLTGGVAAAASVYVASDVRAFGEYRGLEAGTAQLIGELAGALTPLVLKSWIEAGKDVGEDAADIGENVSDFFAEVFNDLDEAIEDWILRQRK